MKKVRKMVAVMLLMVFGAVSVGFGVEIPKYHDSRYQKLKTEVEEVKKALKNYQNDAYCEFEESPRDGICKAMNVIAFFDEIRATDIDVKAIKCGTEECRKWDAFYMAIKKVMEMPRFKKNGSGISKPAIMIFDTNRKARFRSDEGFWEDVWDNWERTKLDIDVGLAKQGVFDEWKDGK